MPRFYFHINDERDTGGTELADLSVAKCDAIKFAGTVICDDAHKFWDHSEWTMTVTDGTGLTLFQLLIVGTEAACVSSARPARSATAV